MGYLLKVFCRIILLRIKWNFNLFFIFLGIIFFFYIVNVNVNNKDMKMSFIEINFFLEVEWLGGGSGEVDVSWVILGDFEVDFLKKIEKFRIK